MEIDLKSIKPDIRYLNEIKSVVFDQEWVKSAPNFELYYMYRGVDRKDSLRYDITIIPPRLLGEEFTKTKGHYHPGSYPELYIVLEGKAIYLMQKRKGGNDSEIEDVYAIEVGKNECVIIPPAYGHITINPSGEILKMANWVSDEFKSIYEPFEEKMGAAYFYTKDGWIKNKNYKEVPELRFEKPLKSAPEDLNFLKG